MPWSCRFHEQQPENPQIGDMWYAREWLNPAAKGTLSDQYWREHASRRPPLVVVFPGDVWFCVDRAAGNGTGWTVTGEPPNITVHPSIRHIGGYHGWLQNGVLSDDVGGRKF